ncbi:MAG: AAA family ATPase [Sphingobacteriales bacterium]|nr:AAA family ATPase [Sphingobacteriales bacterium]
MYGSLANADEVLLLVEQVLRYNEQAEQNGLLKSCVCIWGKHGTGKTELVQYIAQKNGLQCCYVAAAQLEEMGDWLGMPFIDDRKRTHFAPPQWVPQTAGGILLLDDFNRAEERIIRGLMQLLLQQQLMSWKLPPRWTVICTANPDNGDYAVSRLDDALLTRLLHISLRWDTASWVRWALRNGIDTRCIAFVQLQPNLMQAGERTTPRTLTQFFSHLSHIPDWEQQKFLVALIAQACLDDNTAAAFMGFLEEDLQRLVSPQQLLSCINFEQEIAPLLSEQGQRIDKWAALIQHLYLYIHEQPQHILTPQALNNLYALLTHSALPADLRYVLMRQLAGIPHSGLQQLLAKPELHRFLLMV